MTARARAAADTVERVARAICEAERKFYAGRWDLPSYDELGDEQRGAVDAAALAAIRALSEEPS